jgi:hypothetical protein
MYANDPEPSFMQDRTLIRLKTHARNGAGVCDICVGISER